ncbi:MAG: VOC family protein [Janthinobacterium lividum]
MARPVGQLARAERMYVAGLGLSVLGQFRDHQGFDGVMLGHPEMPYHFEFTQCSDHPLAPAPTHEDLLVFYIADGQAWRAACDRMIAAGFGDVISFNPYWDVSGGTFEDFDGYRVVLQNTEWSA